MKNQAALSRMILRDPPPQKKTKISARSSQGSSLEMVAVGFPSHLLVFCFYYVFKNNRRRSRFGSKTFRCLFQSLENNGRGSGFCTKIFKFWLTTFFKYFQNFETLSQDFSFFSQGFRVCPKISSFRPEIFKLLPQDFDLLPQTFQVFAPRFLKFVSRFSKLGKQVGGNINF